MNRILLRFLNSPALVLIGVLGIALQTSFFTFWPLNYLQPDVVLFLVIWVALRRGFVEGGVLTLLLGDIAELHSASPQGAYLVTYMLVFLGVRGLSRLIVIPNHSSLVILTLFASVFWKCELLALLHMLGVSASQWRHTLMLLFPGAVVEGLLGIWAFPALEKFDWVTFKNPRADQSARGAPGADDEILLEGEF